MSVLIIVARFVSKACFVLVSWWVFVIMTMTMMAMTMMIKTMMLRRAFEAGKPGNR